MHIGEWCVFQCRRTELIEALTSKESEDVKSRVGLYTCCPYTFLVGIHDNSYFLIDTHPVAEDRSSGEMAMGFLQRRMIYLYIHVGYLSIGF